MFKSRKSLNTLPKGEVQDMSFYYETHRGDSIKVINTKYALDTVSYMVWQKNTKSVCNLALHFTWPNGVTY